MGEIIAIDGSSGEGGGQVLRTSLALSVLTGKKLEIFNVRAGRSKPGLRAQHLQAVAAAATVCRAVVAGAEIGSQSIRFGPGRVRPGDYRFDIGTAGSTSLVLQTIYLPLALARDGPSIVTITGGTHALWAPCFHYLDLQWRPFLERIGLRVQLSLEAAGYYPRGGGEITATIHHAGHLDALTIPERGELRRIAGISSVTGLPMSIAQRQKDQAVRRLGAIRCPVEIDTVDLGGVGQGTMLLLAAEFEHSRACYYGQGARGKRAEAVADEAVDPMLRLIRGAGHVDEHLADQIILPLAAASGTSSFVTPEVTTHLLTNIEVIRRFLPAEIGVEGELGSEGRITVKGYPG